MSALPTPPSSGRLVQLWCVSALLLGTSCILDRAGIDSSAAGEPNGATSGSGGAATSTSTTNSGGATGTGGGQGGGGQGGGEVPPTVGNCVLDSPETCDDCNQLAGDGCDEQGQIEPGWVCTTVGALCMAVSGIVPGASSTTALVGEASAANFASDCPAGQLLVGVEATNSGDWPGGSQFLSYVTPLCATPRVNSEGRFAWADAQPGITYGGVDDCCVNNVTPFAPALCAQDRFVTGFTAYASGYVTTLSLQCAAIDFDGQAVALGAADQIAGPMGNSQGTTGSEACGAQTAAAALIGKAGAVLDNVGLRCDALGFSLCGDGVQGPAEACEDGNALNGDGCSARCTIE